MVPPSVAGKDGMGGNCQRRSVFARIYEFATHRCAFHNGWEDDWPSTRRTLSAPSVVTAHATHAGSIHIEIFPRIIDSSFVGPEWPDSQHPRSGTCERLKTTWYSAILLIALLTATPPNQSYAQQPTVSVGASDIGGVVTGANGPEAGVWVIAETNDLPTPYAKIVVTDDRGRYLIPDLPKANYSVWVRGYGLADSAKVPAQPGKLVNLRVRSAASAAADAQNYPPIYWFSLLRVPKKDEFPLQKIKSQGEWLNIVKSGGCQSCHPMGTPGTRTIAKAFTDGAKTGADAWTRRVAAGSAQMFMTRDINRLDTQKALDLFGDWTDRIADGELPFAKPERPAGIERNVVITQWDWGQPTAYLHDAISTDRRNPRLNANGKVYGSPEDSTDLIPVLDPVSDTASEVKHPVRDPKTPNAKNNPFGPSSYWGDKPIWDSQTINHNVMLDEKGRVWLTARIRPHADPDFCKEGSSHPSAKAFPLKEADRHVSMYDPTSGKFTLIGTCFPTHHLNFATDANQTLWTVRRRRARRDRLAES